MSDLRIAVDFDGNDWAALYALPSDAANLFTAEAVTDIGNMKRQVSGAGSSVATTDAVAYGDDRAKYGIGILTWTTGTDAAANVQLGYNGSSYDMAAQADGTYTAVIWLKLSTGADTDTFRVNLRRNLNTTVASGTAGTINATTWTQFTVSGTKSTSTTNELYLSVARVTGTTSHDVLIAGAMVVSGSTAPEFFNIGANSLLEPITGYVMNADWKLGFVRPYQVVAPVGKAVIELVNADRRFSPEYASGALFGLLKPGRLVQVGDPDHGIWWTGWTDSFLPMPGANKDRTARMEASDGRRFLQHSKVHPALSAGASSETDHLECVADVMAEVTLPQSQAYSNSESIGDFQALAAGSSYWPAYYFDSNEEGDDAVQLITDILTSVQGHFLFSRTGRWTAVPSVVDNAAAASQNIDYEWMHAEYVYGDRLVNRCEVTVTLKKISGSTVTLWELDENIDLAAGESQVMRVNFRNLTGGTNGDKVIVGGTNLAIAGWTLSSGTVPTHVTVTISESSAQSALLTIANISGTSRTVTAGTITGNKVIALRTLVKAYEDATSIAAYGMRTETIKSEWIASRLWARKLAKWMVTRFKDPRGEIRSVEIDADKNRTLVFNSSLGVTVRVKDDEVDHEGIYAVIGESHRARDALKDHVTTLYLEPAYDDLIEDVTLP